MKIELKSFKLFFILLFCVVFILVIQTGVKAVALQVFETTDGYSKHTFIVGIKLQGKVKEQATSELENKINQWEKQNIFNLSYQDEEFELPSSIISFDIENSVSKIKDGQNNRLKIEMNENELKEFLQSNFGYQIYNLLDVSKLLNDIRNPTEQLSSESSNFDLTKYIKDTNQILTSTTFTYVGNRQDVNTFLSEGNNILVKANSQFSLSKFVSEKKIKSNKQSLSMIASAIYQLILQTNFQIVQRDISSNLPIYAALGKEVRVEKGINDFSFKNGNNTDYVISLKNEGNEMSATLKGIPFIKSYTVDTSEQKAIDSKNINLLSSTVNNQENGLIQKGAVGQTVKVFRSEFDVNGKFLRKVFISEDTYLPTNKINIIKQVPVQNDHSDQLNDTSDKTTDENKQGNISDQKNNEENLNQKEGN